MKRLLLLLVSVLTILSCENRGINDKINQEPPSVTDQHSPKVYFPVNKDYVEKRVTTLLSTIKETLEPILTESENKVLSSLKYEYVEEERHAEEVLKYNKNKHLFVVNLPSLNFTLESKTEECRDDYIDYLIVSRFLEQSFRLFSHYHFYESLHQFLIPELERTNKLGKKEIYNCNLFNDFERTNESFLVGLIMGKSRRIHPKRENIPLFLEQINHQTRDHRIKAQCRQRWAEPKSENPYHEDNFPYPGRSVSKTEKNNAIYLGIHFANTLSRQDVPDVNFYEKASLYFQKFLSQNSKNLKKDSQNCIANFSNINPLSFNLKSLDKTNMDKFSLYKFEKDTLHDLEKPEFTVEKINKNYDICLNQEILSKAYEKGLKYKNILENALKIDADRAPIKSRLENKIHYLNTAYVQKMGTYEEAFSNLREGTPVPNFPKYNDINTAKKSICIRFHEDKIKKSNNRRGPMFDRHNSINKPDDESFENRNIYLFRMDLTEGKIIGEHVYNKSNPKAARLSTALYYAYKKGLNVFSENTSPLRTVESFNVSNDESTTVMRIIRETHLPDTDGNSEFEIEFDAESIEAIALLGTPNLKSCYWLAHDFMDEMGRKKPKKVRIRCSKDSEISPSLFHTDLVVDFE